MVSGVVSLFLSCSRTKRLPAEDADRGGKDEVGEPFNENMWKYNDSRCAACNTPGS